jgi:hypothetical protein
MKKAEYEFGFFLLRVIPEAPPGATDASDRRDLTNVPLQ